MMVPSSTPQRSHQLWSSRPPPLPALRATNLLLLILPNQLSQLSLPRKNRPSLRLRLKRKSRRRIKRRRRNREAARDSQRQLTLEKCSSSKEQQRKRSNLSRLRDSS